MREYTKDKIIVKASLSTCCAVKEKFYEIHEQNLLDFPSNTLFVPNKTLHGYFCITLKYMDGWMGMNVYIQRIPSHRTQSLSMQC